MKLVMVVLVAIYASYAYADAEIMVSPKWTKEPVAEAQLDGLKKLEHSRKVSGTIWHLDTGKLIFIGAELETYGVPKKRLDEVEQGMDQALAKSVLHVVSNTRRTENDRLIIDQVLEGAGAHIHMRRIYATDRDDVLYMAFATCNSPQASPSCDAALDTLRIPVQAFPIEDHRATALAYRLGRLMGLCSILAFIGWLITRAVRRKKKDAPLPTQRSV